LIVTCERCASQFQLDESKIPPQGARVRCSRCEHAFFVESPAQPDADHAEDLVRDVLGADRAGTADPGASGPSAPEQSLASVDAADPVELERAEDDWQFNDETGAMKSDEFDAAQEAVDDLLGGIQQPTGPIQSTAADDSEQHLDLDLGEQDDIPLALDTDLDDEIEHEPPVEAIAASEPDETAESSFDSDDDLAIESPPAAALSSTPDDAHHDDLDDDFEDPTDWDLFGAETDGETSGLSENAPTGAAARSETGSSLSDSFSSSSIGAEAGLRGGARPSRFVSGVVASVGWVVVATLVGFCLNGALSAPKAKSDSTASVVASDFELQGVSTRWIDNAVAGRTVVISGKLRRSPGSARPTPLAVQLIDANGRSVDIPLSSLGPEIPERSLRDTNPTQLVEQQNARAARFAARAADWRRFTAVVPALPDAAQRIEFSPVAPDAGS